MQDDLLRVETELLRVVSAEDDFLTDVASHLINAGGKRVRPGFCIAAAAVDDVDSAAASIDVIAVVVRSSWFTSARFTTTT